MPVVNHCPFNPTARFAVKKKFLKNHTKFKYRGQFYDRLVNETLVTTLEPRFVVLREQISIRNRRDLICDFQPRRIGV